MVMKVAHTMSISPASSVYDLWTGTYTLNEFDTDALTIATGTKTYKSSVVDNWSDYQISAVSHSFINAITVLLYCGFIIFKRINFPGFNVILLYQVHFQIYHFTYEFMDRLSRTKSTNIYVQRIFIKHSTCI